MFLPRAPGTATPRRPWDDEDILELAGPHRAALPDQVNFAAPPAGDCKVRLRRSRAGGCPGKRYGAAAPAAIGAAAP